MLKYNDNYNNNNNSVLSLYEIIGAFEKNHRNNSLKVAMALQNCL